MFRRIAGYDTGLWVAVFALLAISIYVLMTGITGLHGDLDRSFGQRQIVFSVLGIVGAVMISRIEMGIFSRYWLGLYTACLASIAVVYLLGTVIRGSRRWIELGPVNIQPSETGKVLVILAIAGFLTTRSRDLQSRTTFVVTLGMAALPAALVFMQPDFGTAQVYGYIGLAMAFFAGARWLHLATLGGVVALVIVLVLALLPAIGVHVLHDFQTQRLTGFLNPEDDPQGANYQAIQAKIAIGSGRLTGKPAGEASQVQQAFLPEPQTDFIFATLSERHGFVGGATVLLLYMLLVSRCLRAVAVAPTLYGRLVCGSIATMFAAQVFTNVGMVVGLMPITGVPLPLVSYGGSAMLANLAAVGIVAGVLRQSETATVRYARRVGPTAASHMLSLRPTGRRRANRVPVP